MELNKLDREFITRTIDERLESFEDRLATAMTKAFDTVLNEYEGRIRSLEEDLARVFRHTGLSDE